MRYESLNLKTYLSMYQSYNELDLKREKIGIRSILT